MHYLVVAKVKDYPDVVCFMIGLLRHTYANKNTESVGKWEDVTEEFDIYRNSPNAIMEYISEIDKRRTILKCGESSLSKDEIDDVMSDIFLRHGFIAKNDRIYAKVSGYFDYIRDTEKYGSEEETETAKYKDVIAKFGKVDVFVLPDFECRFTNHRDVECPFEDDDEVWVLDGYTYCNW